MNFAEMNGEQLQARMDELIAETSEEKRDALDVTEEWHWLLSCCLITNWQE